MPARPIPPSESAGMDPRSHRSTAPRPGTQAQAQATSSCHDLMSHNGIRNRHTVAPRCGSRSRNRSNPANICGLHTEPVRVHRGV